MNQSWASARKLAEKAFAFLGAADEKATQGGNFKASLMRRPHKWGDLVFSFRSDRIYIGPREDERAIRFSFVNSEEGVPMLDQIAVRGGRGFLVLREDAIADWPWPAFEVGQVYPSVGFEWSIVEDGMACLCTVRADYAFGEFVLYRRHPEDGLECCLRRVHQQSLRGAWLSKEFMEGEAAVIVRESPPWIIEYQPRAKEIVAASALEEFAAVLPTLSLS